MTNFESMKRAELVAYLKEKKLGKQLSGYSKWKKGVLIEKLRELEKLEKPEKPDTDEDDLIDRIAERVVKLMNKDDDDSSTNSDPPMGRSTVKPKY